jgi:pimeloyl-ACP methyl ester carboxylesterase
MGIPTLPGVSAETITTSRLTTRVLFSGPEDGIPVLFVHGNFSSATWWEQTMLALPGEYRAIAPDQRGLGESDPAVVINAQNGMGDFVEDAIALMDQLGYRRFHLVGNSLGGLVAWWMMADAPAKLISVTLAGPGSPFGFGGTKDARGTPTYSDYAGSGGGLANPVLYQGLMEGNRSLDSPFSPRSALRLLVWGPPFVPEREEAFLDAMFQVQLGEKGIPGDKVDSANWPYVAPGKWGHLNAMSPRYIGNLIKRILDADPKTRVLWIYGADDVAVSNSAASDPGTWGPTGRVPGYPGADEYPPQPMMDQIRKVLDDYQSRGGSYREIAVEGSGHVPFLSDPDAFDAAFHQHLRECGEAVADTRTVSQ